jgi:hypothetical protein
MFLRKYPTIAMACIEAGRRHHPQESTGPHTERGPTSSPRNGGCHGDSSGDITMRLKKMV